MAHRNELEALLRKGTSGRVLAVAMVVVGYPVLLAAAWLLGPFTPASHWFPTLFAGSIVALAGLTFAAGRVFKVAFGITPLQTDDEAKRALLEKVRQAKWPIDACIDCIDAVPLEAEGTCPACRQRYTVMRVSNGNELVRLETLLFGGRE